MRLLIHMPVKNEADRWLEACLQWASTFADELHVYDDRSDDDTASVASSYANVTVRGPAGPSFLEHEGQFRENAWHAFEVMAHPEPGDWVLALDADEFLVGNPDVNLRELVLEHCGRADATGAGAILLPVPEMFGADFGPDGRVTKLHQRMDGLWRSIRGTRLFRYQEGGSFRNKPMGCGSEPTYVTERPAMAVDDLWLLHLGYVRDEDKTMKHERYSSLLDHGHNNDHVQSIVRKRRERDWDGPLPSIWLGTYERTAR